MSFKWPFFRTRKIKCPDGTIRIVHKDIDDLFPLSISDNTSSLNGGLKIPEGLEANIGADLTKAIKGVLFSIDGNNSSLILDQRAAYTGYATNPCEKADWYQRQIEDLSTRRHRLQEQERLLGALLSLADSPMADKTELLGILSQLVDKLPPDQAALITVNEMDLSEQTAIEMTREADDES